MPIEELKHACGLFGIYAIDKNVAWLTVRALDGQQTRGQEGAGIATTDGTDFFLAREQGLVIQAFPNQESVSELNGHIAIGHVRYSTTGLDKECNVQPLRVKGPNGEICLGHNGNLINASQLREELEKQGVVFESTTDSEVIAQLLVREPGKDWVERLRAVMGKIVGSYCLVILTRHAIILARDPTGNRPLTIGKTDGYWSAASESGVFNNQPTEFLREVEPGEIVVLHEDAGMLSYPLPTKMQQGLCTFEWIYFMRPDSVFGGIRSAVVRKNAGRLLAKKHPVDADIVVPVPRSGFWGADGFHAESGIPLEHAIVYNTHLRVFLTPNQEFRGDQNDLKYSVLRESVEGKRVIVVDDSIVRGNSNKRLLRKFKQEGAKEIHFRSTFPPVVKPCHLGIDMHTQEELIAARYQNQDELERALAEYWGIDSVGYNGEEDLIQAIGLPNDILCLGCVGGRYAYPLNADFRKDQFELVTAS